MHGTQIRSVKRDEGRSSLVDFFSDKGFGFIEDPAHDEDILIHENDQFGWNGVAIDYNLRVRRTPRDGSMVYYVRHHRGGQLRVTAWAIVG